MYNIIFLPLFLILTHQVVYGIRISVDSTNVSRMWLDIPLGHYSRISMPGSNIPLDSALIQCVLTFMQITLRTVSYPHIWNHLINSGVTHYCGAPTVQVLISLCAMNFTHTYTFRLVLSAHQRLCRYPNQYLLL